MVKLGISLCGDRDFEKFGSKDETTLRSLKDLTEENGGFYIWAHYLTHRQRATKKRARVCKASKSKKGRR